MKILGLLFCILVIALPKNASANVVYDYEMSVIDSLGSLHDAFEQFEKNKTDHKTDNPLNAVLRATVLMKSDIKNASAPLESYLSMKDQNISQNAELILRVFGLFEANMGELETSLEKMLNDPSHAASQQGTTHRQVYEMEAKMNRAWDDLAQATALSALALKNFDRPINGEARYFRVTEKERQDLKNELLKRYGFTIKFPTTDQTPGYMVPGHLFWDFLNNPKWISEDK